MRLPILALLVGGLFCAASSPLAAEPITIPGPNGALAGEAILVKQAQAAIVIVPGSGPVDRDGNGPPGGLSSDSYRLLAEGLAAEGISTLRIDKRGFFGSEKAVANPEAVTIETYASDVLDWLDAFSTKAKTDCAWIAGHSEGGLVALVAAARQTKPCGLILLATPGRRISDLMREQFRRNPANGPYLDELDGLVASLEKGVKRPEESITPILMPFFRSGLQSYMIQLFKYDPAAIAKTLSLPVLILQGDRDFQVTPHDAVMLSAAMPHARLSVLPGVTHMLKKDVPGQPFATYQDPALPLAPGIVPLIDAFIQNHQQ